MQKHSIKYSLFLLTMMVGGFSFAQKEAQMLYQGNNYYQSGQMENAISHYREALKTKVDYKKANFNLGDAIYKEALGIKNSKSKAPIMGMKPDSLANLMLDDAAGQFDIVSQSVSDKDTLHKSLHNLGNCRLMQKNYQGAVDSYKKSLKVDPKDEETRYNLAYAQKKLKEQQKNDKNKDKKDQKQQQQQNQPKMSKQEAERMLNALKNNEQKLQGKKKKGEGEKTKTDKDW